MSARIAAPSQPLRAARTGVELFRLHTLVPYEGARLWLRRAALFLVLLLSGGNVLVPRAPMFVAVIVLAMALRFPSTLIERAFARIWLLIVGIVAVAIVGIASGYSDGVAGRVASIFTGMLMLSVYRAERPSQLIDDLLPILQLMAVQAVLTPVLALLFPNAFMSFYVGNAGGVATYRSLLLIFTYHDTAFGAQLIKRPDGFFWEPGVFQIYLNLFLYISAFITKRWRDMVLAMAAILTLQSTTGLLIACLIMGAFWFQRWRIASVTGKSLILIGALIVATPLAIITASNVSDKLFGASRGSGIARMFDITTGLNVVARYPIAGLGFDANRFSDVSYGLADRSSDLQSDSFLLGRSTSNGIIEMLTMIGVPLSLFFLYGFFRQRFFPHKLIIALTLLMTCTGEALAFTPFFIMIILSALLLGPRRAN